MAKLTYNGITLEISDTKSVSRQSVYSEDGQTYLHTRWLFTVCCQFNPGATTSQAGVAKPATTDIAIRNALMQPRKTLTYVDEAAQGGVTVLTCPAAGFECDAKGGPYPRDCRILQIAGSRTWAVLYVLEAFTNEATAQEQANRNVILSHRWDVSADYDEDQFATRVVRGVAVFNLAQLKKLGRVPDEFRRDLFHPVPTNFKRTAVNVQPSSDGTTIYYTVVDTEQPINLNVADATRFEAYHTSFSNRPSIIDASWRTAEAAGRSLYNVGTFDQNPVAAARSFGREFISNAASVLPQYYSHCIARAWGNRLSTRKRLQDLCFQICVGRLDFLNLMTLNAYAGIEISVTHALHAKFVEVQATVRHGPNPMTGFKVAAMLNDFPDYDDVKTDDGGIIGNAGDGNNPPFINSNGTRGSWLGSLVAQALESQGSVPAAPANQNVQDQSFR